MIGFDTSALIDLYKEDAHLISVLEQIDEELVVNDLTYLELSIGLNAKKHQQEEQFYDALYDSLATHTLSKEASKKAREIRFLLKKKGKQISSMDAAIAAIYLTNNVNAILTKNVKDFKQIPGLTVLSY